MSREWQVGKEVHTEESSIQGAMSRVRAEEGGRMTSG